MNDAQCYRSLPQIGLGRARDLLRWPRILADGGYSARLPVITPRQIARNRKQLQANRVLRSLRMQIEHSIGVQKVYASINSIFSHKRFFFALCCLYLRFIFKQEKINHPQTEASVELQRSNIFFFFKSYTSFHYLRKSGFKKVISTARKCFSEVPLSLRPSYFVKTNDIMRRFICNKKKSS